MSTQILALRLKAVDSPNVLVEFSNAFKAAQKHCVVWGPQWYVT